MPGTRDSFPLISHDSLGIWIGDTIQRNRIGTEHWRDAWILELARGSLTRPAMGQPRNFRRKRC